MGREENLEKATEVWKLKKRAAKLGYYLTKMPKYDKYLPCSCGGRKRKNIHTTDINNNPIVLLECYVCGRKVQGFTLEEAKANWNKVMEEEGVKPNGRKRKKR